MDRIKGLHEKQGSSYSAFMPFGTDGQLVDMASGLNLEYEVKIGTPHYVSINDSGASIVITEHYDANAAPSGNFYKMVTTITETSDTLTTITAVLSYGTTSSQTTLKTKTTTIDQSTGTIIREVIA